MYWLLLSTAGAITVIYVTARWVIYLAQTQSWVELFLILIISFLVSVGLWLRFRWAVYLLTAAIGIGSAVVSSENINFLLPPP
jgi:hypothetical protein